MRIKELQRGFGIVAQNDLDAGMTKQPLKLIQAGAVVEISQHDQAVPGGQMPDNPLPQPDTLRQLLAAVFNRNPSRLGIIPRAMRGLGFGMHADDAKLFACHLQRQFQGWFGKPDRFGGGVGIQINDARTGNKLPLNTASNDYVLRPQSNTFDFTASYVRLVADTEASGDTPGVRGIGTGKVNALASFDVTYK